MNLTGLHIRKVHGKELLPLIHDLGKLRIAVFYDFPYLYEGTPEYERAYLETYALAKNSFVLAVYDGNEMIGATTAVPLSEETAAVRKPFEDNGTDISSTCYFGESLLLPYYRGRGIGHLFFDEREAFAKRLGHSLTTFCAVDRPEDHPLKPANYRPNNAFWQKRGYREQSDLTCEMWWKDRGQAGETRKQLTFWTKSWK